MSTAHYNQPHASLLRQDLWVLLLEYRPCWYSQPRTLERRERPMSAATAVACLLRSSSLYDYLDGLDNGTLYTLVDRYPFATWQESSSQLCFQSTARSNHNSRT
eukprot:scaffold41808_cov16-Tisochrysis_lutea.AAC.2